MAAFGVGSAVAFVFAVGPERSRTAFLVAVSSVKARFALAVPGSFVAFSMLRMAVTIVFAVLAVLVVRTLPQVS